MVNNDDKILDGMNYKKYIPTIEMNSSLDRPPGTMTDKKVKAWAGRVARACDQKSSIFKMKRTFNEETLEYEEESIVNEDYKSYEDFPMLRYAEKRKKQNMVDYMDCFSCEECFVQDAGMDTINEYLGIVPFKRSIFINISPHWSEGLKKKLQEPGSKRDAFIAAMCGRLVRLAKLLGELDWFVKNEYEFVVETGEGDHPHLHAVYTICPSRTIQRQKKGKDGSIYGMKTASSFDTWMKSNWKNSVRKVWSQALQGSDLEKGEAGALKGGRAMQSNLLNYPEMLQDKLDYLHEERKPIDHKNRFAEESIYFTAKI